MKRIQMPLLFLMMILCLGMSWTAGEAEDTNLNSLVQAEKDFARTSMEKGMREAFLAYLADDAVVFRPKPVPGRPVYERLPPESTAYLNWRPVFAEVSQAGDLGYTTGPYEFRASAQDAASARFGHYVTVWKKQADRSWKALLDGGIPHARPVGLGDEVKSPARSAAVPRRLSFAELEKETDSLKSWDRNFGQLAFQKDLAEVYRSMTAEDIRLYRAGAFPVTGQEAMEKLLSEAAVFMVWEPEGAGIAESGDLAYTYGTGKLKKAEAGPEKGFSYLRLWRKPQEDRPWKVILEVVIEFELK